VITGKETLSGELCELCGIIVTMLVYVPFPYKMSKCVGRNEYMQTGDK